MGTFLDKQCFLSLSLIYKHSLSTEYFDRDSLFTPLTHSLHCFATNALIFLATSLLNRKFHFYEI